MFLAGVNVVIMVLRFTEQSLLARALGAGQQLDAYFVGQVVLLIGGQFAIAITSAAVPVLTEVGTPNLQAATRRLLQRSVAVGLICVALFACASWPIITTLGGKLDSRSAALAREIFLWLLPATVASMLAGLLRAHWHVQRNFLVPAVAQLLIPLCTCCGAALLAVGVLDLTFVAAVANLGALLLLVCLYKPLLGPIPKDQPGVTSTGALAQRVEWRFLGSLIPVGVGLSLMTTMVAFGRFFASSLHAGSVTAISLAASIASIPGQFAAASVGTVLLPQTSSLNKSGLTLEATRLVERALRTTAFLAIPCAVVLVLYSSQLVEIVFKRGAFGSAAVGLTASALKAYAAGIPALVASQVLMFALFGMSGRRQVAIMAVATLSLNLLLSRALLRFGLFGVASSFSVACIFNAGALMWLLARASSEFRLWPLLFRYVRIGSVSIISGLSAFVCCQFLRVSHVAVSFAFGMALAGTMYAVLSWLFANSEMHEILDTVRSRYASGSTDGVPSSAD